MTHFSLRRAIIVSGTLILPFLFGQGCPFPGNNNGNNGGNNPPPGQATTLLTSTDAAPPFKTFNPTATGKTVSVSVAGNATGSRIRVLVQDFNGGVVLNLDNPTTNVSTGSFTSTTTGQHFLTTVEVGTPSTLYTTTVTQAP